MATDFIFATERNYSVLRGGKGSLKIMALATVSFNISIFGKMKKDLTEVLN